MCTLSSVCVSEVNLLNTSASPSDVSNLIFFAPRPALYSISRCAADGTVFASLSARQKTFAVQLFGPAVVERLFFFGAGAVSCKERRARRLPLRFLNKIHLFLSRNNADDVVVDSFGSVRFLSVFLPPNSNRTLLSYVKEGYCSKL